ncbi:MAG: hypothetical protein CMO55_19525 [Verrucomicrobiales bacterium]|nr:hypothetical protein [Verrucomicrobiales bacterium]
MPSLTVILGAIVLIIIIGLAGLKILGIWSKKHPPESFGIEFLEYDPGTPNFVSSKASKKDRHVEPLKINGDSTQALSDLKDIVSSFPRTEITHISSDELRAETTSPFFGFVDDLVFILQPEESQIEVRSSSRVGHSDMGTNAERIQKIREHWEKRTPD